MQVVVWARRGALVAGLLSGLLFAGQAGAVTLVNPDGSPVGGQWQQWVDQMRVPTISGRLVFSSDLSDVNAKCFGAEGCSWGAPDAETIVAPDALARDTLYFELGHQFDFAYLTGWERHYLAVMWQRRHTPWLDSTAGLSRNSEDGLEGIFAAVYDDCAIGQSDQHGSVWLLPPGGGTGFAAYPQINTCRFIDKVARRHHAAMEATRLAPRNRQGR